MSNGLDPHEFALFAGGSLFRTGAFPPPAKGPDHARMSLTVETSSKRYARREDSEWSPLGLSSERTAQFLQALPSLGGGTRLELAKRLGWPPGEIDAAIARCKAVEDIVESGSKWLGLTRGGLFHQEALNAARNEGEEHTELLAEIACRLGDLGIRFRNIRFGEPDEMPQWEYEAKLRGWLRLVYRVKP
jgi:hypothetical protein